MSVAHFQATPDRLRTEASLTVDPLTSRYPTILQPYDWANARYLYERACSINFMNANGLAARQTAVVNAMSQFYDAKNIKDLDTTLRDVARDQIMRLIDLLFNLKVQLNTRKVHTVYCKGLAASVVGILTISEWQTVVQEITASGIVVPTWIVKLMDKLCPLMLTTLEMPARNMPMSFFQPWTSTWDLAAILTAIRALAAYQGQAVSFWQSMGMPTETLTIESLTHTRLLFHMLDSDETLFWRTQLQVHYRNAAAAIVSRYPYGLTAAADLITDMVAAWEREYYWIGRPDPLHRLIPFISEYSAANNPTGCLQLENPGANSRWGVRVSSYDGASRIFMTDAAANTLTMYDLFPVTFANVCVISPVGMAAGTSNAYTLKMTGMGIKFNSTNYLVLSSLSNALLGFMIDGSYTQGVPRVIQTVQYIDPRLVGLEERVMSSAMKTGASSGETRTRREGRTDGKDRRGKGKGKGGKSSKPKWGKDKKKPQKKSSQKKKFDKRKPRDIDDEKED